MDVAVYLIVQNADWRPTEMIYSKVNSNSCHVFPSARELYESVLIHSMILKVQ